LSEERDDENNYDKLPVGVPDSFRIVAHYPMPSQLSLDSLNLDPADINRLSLTPHNVTIPIALLVLDPLTFPSLSRARKACRKGNILIHRGPLQMDPETGEESIFVAEKSSKGLVGDRVYPGDVLARQVRIGTGSFAVLRHQKPLFDLPVVYEDDYFALVNKPAGVVVYSHKNAGHGTMTVRACLPFVLQPSKRGTYAVMRRPASVHRLDKPTSGLLCVAKTKPAMMNLSKQFHDRVIQKTYFAIVNGIPQEDTPISTEEALKLGVDVDPNDKRGGWQLIASKQDGREAVTVWRAVRYAKSLRANNGYLTLVEMKPKTGRYHQLRRHMAWECGCPLVGDQE
jgi:23S rRNA-/tRNA-specific pseudouridylate synthase